MNNRKLKSRNSRHGYEERDVRAGRIAFIALGLLIGTGGVMLLTSEFNKRVGPADSEHGDQTWETFPEPALQVAPSDELEIYLARQKEELSSYGWIDRSQGIVRLPVERAIDRIAREGLPETSQRVTRLEMLQQKRRETDETR